MLLVTALAQAAIFVATGSVALLADLIHNFGDALTAIPLGIAFLLRSVVAEKRAGYFVVAAIFVSACVAAVEAVDRLIHPQTLDHLWVARRRGRDRLHRQRDRRPGPAAGRPAPRSPALIADGNHARTDGLVVLAVVASAAVVALGFELGDPIIGLVITAGDPAHHLAVVPDDQGRPRLARAGASRGSLRSKSARRPWARLSRHGCERG